MARRPGGITAAAKRLNLGDRKDLDALRRAPDRTALEAWTYFDAVPEVKFYGRFMGAAMSRLRFYPGVVVDPDEPPLFVGDATDRERMGEGQDPIADALAEAAIEELGRVSNRRDGAAGLMRSFGVQLSIPGDSWLVSENQGDGEDWTVYSDTAMTTVESGGKTSPAVREAPGAEARPLKAADGEDPVVIRIWRPHEQWRKWADSPMRALLDVCEELLIWARVFRGVARTRNSNGFLLVPEELDFDQAARAQQMGAEDPTEEGEDGLTKFERDMLDAMLAPIEDESHPAGVAPHVIRGKAEHLEQFRHVPIKREIDEFVVSRLEHLITRFAHGVELPPEFIKGLGDVNHWGAWQIEDSAYKTAVEPTAEIPAWGIRAEWLRPALLTRGFAEEDVDRIVIGIDASSLVARPNQGQDAKDAHEKMVLSDGGLRRRLQIGDTEAPDDDEWLRRMVQTKGTIGPETTAAVLRKLGVDVPEGADKPVVAPPRDSEPAPQDQPIPEEERPEDTDPGETQAIAAAAASANRLGERFVAIDQRLRDRIQVAASSAMTEALRRAGNSLRGRVQGDPEVRREVNGADAAAVGEILGEERATSYATADQLLDGAFADLGTRWESWVAAAQAEVVAAIMADADDLDEGEDAAAEYEAGAVGRRETGWAFLVALLLGFARERLFGTPPVPGVGELDTALPVPPGPVRDALAIAGGGTAGTPGGVASGPAGMRALGRLRNVVQGWEWRVGNPTRPFEPHQRLAGVVFVSFEDERLANGDGWPHFSHFFPGDHAGCQCDAVPIIVRVYDAA